jgi:four helix bundle protein
VIKWEYFERKTLGAQFVDAADSIAFNIAEGYGRFHYKDNKNFCYYSRGSAKETLTAARKAKQRNLISDQELFCLIKNSTPFLD